MKHTYRLILDCPDQVGIVTKVGDFLSQHGGWICDANHHSDTDSNRFFSRIVVNAESLPFDVETLREKFTPLAESLQMNWRIVDSSVPKRVILMASKGSHCLSDLFDRLRYKEFNCEVVAVISNHDDMRGIAEFYGYQYHHVPIEKDSKGKGFAEVERLVDDYHADTIVLARYMQIVPPALCDKYQYQIINIHHSFLPSFIGAKPYHQAFQRGVKLIGATCHYVTQQLDEGPIIEQGIQRITHAHTVDDLVRLGRDVEKTVLAKGLRAHLEDRVMVHGNSTVVFS